VYFVLAQIILTDIVFVYCSNIRHIFLVQCYALTILWMFEITLLNLVTYCGPNRPIRQSFLSGDVFLNSGTMVMPLKVL
jgi:hypothetical protein